jgi:hypothetical protein
MPRGKFHDEGYNRSNAGVYRIRERVDLRVRNIKSRILKSPHRYTMKVTGTSLVILVLAIMLIPGVSAQDVDNSTGYSVIPAENLHQPLVMSPMTVGSITQGETDWYSVIVPSGASSITVDLNWGYAPDSLSLTAIAPDGIIGPLYDSSDGTTDGRIFTTITRSGGIAPGTWTFKVYGDYVLGTQSYNFVTY